MGVQFCTPPPKKDPYKTQHKNGLSAVWRHLSGMPFYKHPSSSYSLVQDAWKHLHGLFFVNHLQMDGFLAIMKSLPSVPSTSCLSTATWKKVFFLFNIFLLFFKKNIYIHTNVNYNNITKQRHILVKTYYNTILSLSTKRIKVFIVKAKTPS